jgi:hypothetical protein
MNTERQKLVSALTKLRRLGDAKNEATNAYNRQKTVCGKTFRHVIQVENLDEGTKIIIRDKVYMFATTDSERIDPAKWLELLMKCKITKAQFLEAISVGKEVAKRILGEDQITKLLVKEKGTKADIRVGDAGELGGENKIEFVQPLQKPSKATAPLRLRRRTLNLKARAA